MTTDTDPPKTRRFPHLRPLTDEEYAAQHADAIWSDVRSTHYGRAELRHHHVRIEDRLAWRFPYCDRVYVAHREYVAKHGHRLNTWAVSLWLAPYVAEASDLPRDPATAPPVYGEPLLTGARTLQDAVRGLALKLVGSLCDHRYTRGRDSCPGCDMLDDLYDDLP